jgi:hypothetical protein
MISPLLAVPRDLITTNVLPILDTKSLAMASRVCRQFRAFAEAIPPRFGWEQMLRASVVRDVGAASTRLDSHVRCVKVVGNTFSPAALRLVLNKYRNIVGLDLGNCTEVPIATLQELGKWLSGKKIEKLGLSCCQQNFRNCAIAEFQEVMQDLFSRMDWSHLKVLDLRKIRMNFVGERSVQVLLLQLPKAKALEEFYVSERCALNAEILEILPPHVRNVSFSIASSSTRDIQSLSTNEAFEKRLRKYPLMDRISVALGLLPARNYPNPIEQMSWQEELAAPLLRHIHRFSSAQVRLGCELEPAILQSLGEQLATSPKLEEFVLDADYDLASGHWILEALKRSQSLKRVKTVELIPHDGIFAFYTGKACRYGGLLQVMRRLLEFPPHIEIILTANSGSNQIFDRSAMQRHYAQGGIRAICSGK